MRIAFFNRLKGKLSSSRSQTTVLLLLLCSLVWFPVSRLAADTVAWPVSLIKPSQSLPSGEVDSLPVSIVTPAANPPSGEVDSKPVSIVSPGATTVSGVIGSMPVSVKTQPANLGDPDLVGLWRMDGDWGDSSGNGNNGQGINGATFSADHAVGSASGSFDGIDDQCPTTDFRLGNHDFTIEAWIKPGSFSGINDSNRIRIFSKDNYPNTWWVVDLYKASSGTAATIAFDCGDNNKNASSAASNATIGLNQWTHIGIVIDRTNFKVRFYINGQFDSEKTISPSMTGNLDVVGKTFTIAGTWNYFKGLIDEVSLYKRAMTTGEIALHYGNIVTDPNAPAPPVLNAVPSVVNTNTITLSGTSALNNSIWVNNTKIAVTDASGNWQGSSYGIQPPNSTLQPGPNILYVRAMDASYRVSQPVTANVFYDPLMPTVTQPASPTNNSLVTLTGTKAANSYLYLNNTLITTVPFANTSWSCPVTLANEGTNTISVYAKDSAGNQSHTASVAVVLDTIPPALFVSALRNGSYTNTQAQNFTGTVTDANFKQLTVSLVNQGQLVVNNQPVTVTNGSYSTAVQLLPGTNIITITAADLAGNVTSDTRTIYFDNNTPVITINTPADNSYTKLATVTVSGSVDRPATVTVGGNPAAMDGTNFSAQVVLDTQGLHQIDVVATDLYNNSSSQKRTITFDNINPQLAIAAPGQDIIATNKSTVSISGTVSDADPITVASTFNGVTAPVAVTNGTYSFSVDFSQLAQGTYPVSVTATDAAGNVTTAIRTVIYDTTGPSLAVDALPSNTGTANLTLSGTVAAPAGVNVTVTVTNPATNASEAATVSEGSWSHAITLVPGPNTITVQAQDAAGNIATQTVTITYLLPAPNLTIYPIAPLSNVPNQVISGTVDAGATVSVTVNSAPAVAAAVTGGTWNIHLSGLVQGGNTITVTAANQFTFTASASASITLDSIPPAIPVITAPVSPTRNSSVTLAGTKDANTYLYVNGQLTVASLSDTSWSYTASLSGGSNSFSVYAKDAAGNVSTTATTSVVRDSTPPTLASSTPGANGFTNGTGTITITLADSYAGVDLLGSLAGAVVKNAAGSAMSGSWSVVGNALVFAPTTQLPDGTYSVTLNPVDLLGNTGTTTFSFTLDRTLPTVQTLTLSPASPVKAGTVTFTLVFSKTMDNSGQLTVTFTSGIFSPTYTLTGAWQDTKTWRGTYPFTTQTGDGSYTVTAAGAKDQAGNVMVSQTTGTFVLMTTPPASPTIGQTTTPTRTGTQALTGTKPANTALVINSVVRVPLNSATTWSYNYQLVEGANNLAIVARDAAGNDSLPLTPAPVVTLDTTPPLFTIDTYKTPSPTVTQTIGGKKEPGCIVTVNSGSGATTIFDATDQNATWSYPVTLVDGLNNHFVLTAADAVGNTTTKTLDILCDTAPPQALAAGILVADGSGKGTEVTLTWPSYIELTDLAYYRVYSATVDYSAVTGLTPVATVNKGTKTYKVTGLTQGSRYYFAVVPVSVSGNTDATIHTASAVPADTLPPEDVTGLAAWAGYNATDGNTVSLSWTASVNSMGTLTDQMVYMDAGQGYDSGTAIGKSVTSYTKKGLKDVTSYKFKVTTKDALGHESAGTVTTAVTRLANPTGLAGVPGSQKVALTWNAVSSPYVKLYNVYRIQSAAPQTDVSVMTLVKSQSGTSFTDTGLTNGVTYQYAVTTLNTSGAERSDVQSVAAAPRSDTTGPVITGVNITANQVITAPLTITVSAQDAESAMGRIEIWIDGVLAATQNGGSVSYAWNVVTTTDGNHTVKIDAYDAPGNPTEQIIPVVVSLAPPPTPVITSTFSAPINQKTATIAGTTQPGATVSLRVNGTVVSSTSASTSTFSFNSVALVEGDNFVAAKAGNRGGDSPFSADMKVTVVTTAPSAPVGLAAKPLAAGSLQFTWQAGGSGAIGYNLYEGTASFGAVTDSGVHKTNSAAIPYLLKEYIPADDTSRFYAVTALDGAGNESPISNVVTIASDRAAPTVSTVSFTDGSGVVAADNTYGPGTIRVAATISEALSEAPFFSLEPQNASPIVIALTRTDDTHYSGSFTVDASSPNGPTVWKFSGKDLVGNRGNGSGTGPTIDVRGPVATITAPVTSLKTTTGPVSVALVFDEPSTAMPTVTLKAADGGTAQVTGLASTDNGLHWSGTIDPSALAEGSAQFLLAGAKDRFGNIGTTIKTGAAIVLYKTTPPASAVPTGLAAKPCKGGAIALSWTKVADAQGYNVYRQGTADAAPVLIDSIATSATVAYTDTPAADGSYAYSVSSLGLLGAESAPCAPVSALSDRTPPAVPTGLALTLSGGGVQATWDTVTPPAEVPVSFRLYRAAAPFSDLTGLTPVATVNGNKATDPAPASAQRFYAITALDALGNESAPSQAQQITFPVAPVANLMLILVDDGKPSLSWTSGEAGLAGFTIYRNGNKVNQTPTSSTSYSDGYYSSGAVTYGVSATDSLGHESPIKEVTLPALAIALKDGATMHRGLLENVTLVATIPADAANSLTLDAVAVKIGTLPESTLPEPFSVAPGTPLEIGKVAATEANAPPQEAVVVTAIMNPAPGTTVKLAKSSLVGVLGSGTALEVFNEPLVRGTQASVRLKVNNLGSAQLSFVTSENTGPTSQVTVNLRDQDGNILAHGNLDQRTGAVVNSGAFATARIEPGGNFLSDPITFVIPASAPYKVVLEAVIGTTFYHYQQDDQVVAPGLTQYLSGTIADVSYMAQASTDKAVYKQGEPVLITGRATSTSIGEPLQLVPVRIGVSVNGFDRFYTVNTDVSGNFSYTFTPATNETGSYSVWASHPDLTCRTVQAQFAIIGLSVTPSLANITILKGQSFDLRVTLRNLGGASLTGLNLDATASSGITASVVNPGADTLAAGETRTVTFRLATATNGPDNGVASLAVATAEGLSGNVDASVNMVTAIPVIATSPSYIDTGIMRGNQRIDSFTIKNTGMGTLMNPRIEGPSIPWLTLTIDKSLGDIPAGQGKSLGVVINPGDTVAQGVYNDRLVIYSDNHIPYTYNIQVTVTSDAVGSVQFSLLDELMKQVGGASITVQNQSVTELLYNLTTATDGTVSLTDIPEGRYTYNITATGHYPYSGSFVITPGVWTTVPVALQVNLVQIDWSVTPTMIQDQYQIKVNQTFATNVPTPVLVTEPPSVTLPDMQPGQVFNGEFTVTNYGLITVDDPQIKYPTSFGEYDVEVLLNVMPKHIAAMQKVTVPYRITKRQTAAFSLDPMNKEIYAASVCNEVGGYGGGTCLTSFTMGLSGTAVICTNTPQQRTADSSTSHTVAVPTNCATGGTAGTYVAPPPSYGAVCTNCQSSSGGVPGASSTPMPTGCKYGRYVPCDSLPGFLQPACHIAVDLACSASGTAACCELEKTGCMGCASEQCDLEAAMAMCYAKYLKCMMGAPPTR